MSDVLEEHVVHVARGVALEVVAVIVVGFDGGG